MAVIIGVDPHKATHTAVAISSGEQELARKKVRSGGTQAEHLLAWAEPFETRTWAIESAAGLGYLLAQQLVAAGETVLDVPATLASRVRVLSAGRSNKTDPNDALSVAIAALGSRGLRRVVSRRSDTVRCCACWPNATPTSATTAVGSCAACPPCSRRSPEGDRQGDQRLRRRRVPRSPHPGHSRRTDPLPPGRRAPPRHPPP